MNDVGPLYRLLGATGGGRSVLSTGDAFRRHPLANSRRQEWPHEESLAEHVEDLAHIPLIFSRLFTASNLHDGHVVSPNEAIPGHEGQPFGLSLGNQEPIEWIPVVHWEAARLLSVMKRQRKVSEAFFLN